MPAVYCSPCSELHGQDKASYLTPRNERSIFPGRKGISFKDITDGTSNTILLLEVPDETAVVWTKPDDFQYDENEPMRGLSGPHRHGFPAGMADGSVRWIDFSIGPVFFKYILTRDGGEPFFLGG